MIGICHAVGHSGRDLVILCCRELERVHAAVMGAHKRHGCLLPLEMYLEEGIPLVCYVRDKPYAEMVELPEQSCHCFLSFSNASAEHPSLKVCCLSHLNTGDIALSCCPHGNFYPKADLQVCWVAVAVLAVECLNRLCRAVACLIL